MAIEGKTGQDAEIDWPSGLGGNSDIKLRIRSLDTPIQVKETSDSAAKVRNIRPFRLSFAFRIGASVASFDGDTHLGLIKARQLVN